MKCIKSSLFAALWILQGCYSFTMTTLPPHLKTLTVLPAENRTSQSVLGDKLSAEAASAFKREAPSLRQIPQGGQAELSLILRDYRNAPSSFSVGGAVQAYQVTLSVDVRFYDQVKKREIYAKQGLGATGTYDISKGETELVGQARALTAFRENLVAGALSEW